jgi:hypothetical protein
MWKIAVFLVVFHTAAFAASNEKLGKRAFDYAPSNLRSPAICMTLMDGGAVLEIAHFKWNGKVTKEDLVAAHEKSETTWGDAWVLALIDEAYAWEGDSDSWIMDEVRYCMNPANG